MTASVSVCEMACEHLKIIHGILLVKLVNNIFPNTFIILTFLKRIWGQI